MVNFDVDAQEIEQRRKYAEMLRQQGMEPVQSQMAGGYVIPTSPVQGLAKMLQAYSGRKGMETADADKRALAEALRNERMGTLERFQTAMEGRPEERGTDPTGGLSVNLAQAPNPKAAMMALATSRDPALSQAGIGAYLAQLSKTPESAFSKINPRDYTADSVRAFAASGGKDFSVLVPRDKMEFVNTGGAVTPMNPYTAQPTGAAINKTVSPDAAMRQRWDEYTFGNLSKNQQESLKNDRAGLGMRGAELFFNTGMTGYGAPGGSVSGPANVPSMVPGAPQAPGMQPAPVAAPGRAAPQGMPMGQVPPAPQMRPGQIPGMTPKMRAELDKQKGEMEIKREFNMRGLQSTIEQARNILSGTAGESVGGVPTASPKPTNSWFGAGVDFLGSVVGRAPEGAAQADQLKAIAGVLTSKMPRMEGPQSDKDVALYRESAGQVGDNTLPVSRRLAALQVVEALHAKYDPQYRVPVNTGSIRDQADAILNRGR